MKFFLEVIYILLGKILVNFFLEKLRLGDFFIPRQLPYFTMPRLTGSKRRYTARSSQARKKRTVGGTVRKLYSAARANYRKPYRYPGLGRSLGSKLGALVGGMYGAPGIGSALGGGLGGLAHAGIKTITGRGDYTVRQNALIYNRDSVPQFTSSNPRCTILTHSEFIRDVVGSVNFQVDSFDINATNPAAFPWLSQIARNYEQVVWQGLVFQFKTTCATAVASTNTALGTVVMATQYDTLSPLFTNKQQMEACEFAQSSVPSASILHAIECDPSLTASQGLFYNDNPANSNVNADPRLYNIGRFNIATVGMQAAATVGELWVTYKVCLLKPKLNANTTWSDHYVLDAGSLENTVPFGENPSLDETSSSYQASLSSEDQMMTALSQNGTPWGEPIGNDVSIIINPAFTGRIMVVYQLHGGSAEKEDPLWAVGGNITWLTDPTNAGTAAGFGFVGYQKMMNDTTRGDLVLSAQIFDVSGGFNSTGKAPYVTIAGGEPRSPTFGNLSIFAIPSNLS